MSDSTVLDRLILELEQLGGSVPSILEVDRVNYLAQKLPVDCPTDIVAHIRSVHSNYASWVTKDRDKLRQNLVRAREIAKLHREVSGVASRTKQTEAVLLPTFELPSTDKERMLQLCDQMRKIVLGADFLDDPHRRRLLNRLAGIEYQIHQPKGLFDVVRGGLEDLGETLGKFGKDVEPLTKRMKEVVGLARRNTGEYDQLPPIDEVEQLPAPDDEE